MKDRIIIVALCLLAFVYAQAQEKHAPDLQIADNSFFDPTAKEDADTEINPMDREQGGMGILIVKNIMNEVSYQRLGEENRLTMKKKL